MLAAEALGTFFLVFPGAGAPMLGNQVGLLGVAIANGLGLAVGITATMNISGGHLNPAVTTGLWAARKIRGGLALLYVLAQLAGATVAACLLAAIFPHGAVVAGHLGAPALNPSLGAFQGMLLEAVMTFLLVTAVFLTVVDDRAPKVAGFGVGTIVMVDVLAGGPLTGAAMNPARAFGPELIGRFFTANWWIWWVGPILGGLAAAALYSLVLRGPTPVAAPSPAPAGGGPRSRGSRGR